LIAYGYPARVVARNGVVRLSYHQQESVGACPVARTQFYAGCLFRPSELVIITSQSGRQNQFLALIGHPATDQSATAKVPIRTTISGDCTRLNHKRPGAVSNCQLHLVYRAAVLAFRAVCDTISIGICQCPRRQYRVRFERY